MLLRSFYKIKLCEWRWGYIRSSYCTSNDNLKSLCKLLKISESKGKLLQMKYPVIKKLDDDKLESIVQTVYDLGYPTKVLVSEPSLFSILPITLKFRYEVLKECGITEVSMNNLISYLKIIRHKKVGDLKREGLIVPSLNVENKLASCLTQWPTSLTTLVLGDYNEYTLFSLRLKIIQRYLELMLDVTQEEFVRGLETYPTLKHRPLKAINETLIILQRDIAMSIEKIKSNFYLIHANPDNLKEIIYSFRSIGGISIKEIIRMHPKIAMKNVNTLREIRQLLDEFGVSPEAQIRCLQLFTLSPATIRERLQKAKEIPELNAFYNHPRFLKVIHYNNTALNRIMKLYKMDKKCLSLNIISGSNAHYEVFEKAPGDRLGKGKDLVFCISQAMGKKYSASKIRNMIKRHPFWINVPLVQVKYVYDQLSVDYSTDDIYENCPILLYPWSKIKETTNLLNRAAKTPTHALKILQEDVDLKRISSKQKLSLVLYLLERNHYFSGNGIWTDHQQKNSDHNSFNIDVKKV
ncbi:transcription termination factor 5, mitochondrial-like [Aricia agestis]|uniref:transcription termination factor 5, mitochondrial-like n=1 Tax=Aricia agestis TaxID=91739 RepID=UPI001C208FB1|nr:transcription termination factor 5, mitochondrial-like [Aricia agestis]